VNPSVDKDVVKRYYEEVVSTGNVERIADFIAPEYTEVYRNVRYPVGIEGACDHVLGVRRTYPDLCLSVGQQIAEGEWVVTQVTMRGTHRSEWLGITPTGKAVEVTAVNVDRVVGGRIVQHGGAANLPEPLLEIGAIRVAGPESGGDRDRARYYPEDVDCLLEREPFVTHYDVLEASRADVG